MKPLDARQIEALYMMLAGESQTYIADTLEVCTRTVRRWADEPQFAAALKKESEALTAVTRAQTLVLDNYNVESGMAASRFLNGVMVESQMPLQSRIRAASQLANISLRSQALAQKKERQQRQQRQQSDAIQPQTESGHVAAPPEKAMPENSSRKAEPSIELPERIKREIQADARAELAKADKTGHKRTSAAEHRARRQRLERLEAQLNEQETPRNEAQRSEIKTQNIAA